MSGLIKRVKETPRPSLRTILCSKTFVFLMAVAYIAVGVTYLKECPKEPYIPIYLVVMGAMILGMFGLVLILIILLFCLPSAQNSEDETANPLRRFFIAWTSLSFSFVFCWFIAEM